MRINPYTRLKDICNEWAEKVQFPHRRSMFSFKKVTIGSNTWQLYDVRERVLAAKQLGYHVEVLVRDDDLIFQYVKDHPTTPWELQ